jgi:ligand-binding sensor domain-containing protein
MNVLTGEFEVFYPEQPQNSSPSANQIKDLHIDPVNNWLWMSTQALSYRMNLKTKQINKIQESPGNDLFKFFCSDNNKNLWAAGSKGICRYDYATNDFEKSPFKIHHDQIDINNIHQIGVLNENKLLLTTTYNGLVIFDKINKTYHSFPHLFDHKTIENPVNNSRCFLIDSKEVLWVGTYKEGLKKNNLHKKNFGLIRFKKHYNNTKPDNNIFSIQKDSKSRLWLGTYNGI